MKSYKELDIYIHNIGQHIQHLRIEKNMTQLDLSIKTDIDVRQIQRLERGHTSPTLKTLYKLIKGLDKTFTEFFSEIEM